MYNQYNHTPTPVEAELQQAAMRLQLAAAGSPLEGGITFREAESNSDVSVLASSNACAIECRGTEYGTYASLQQTGTPEVPYRLHGSISSGGVPRLATTHEVMVGGELRSRGPSIATDDLSDIGGAVQEAAARLEALNGRLRERAGQIVASANDVARETMRDPARIQITNDPVYTTQQIQTVQIGTREIENSGGQYRIRAADGDHLSYLTFSDRSYLVQEKNRRLRQWHIQIPRSPGNPGEGHDVVEIDYFQGEEGGIEVQKVHCFNSTAHPMHEERLAYATNLLADTYAALAPAPEATQKQSFAANFRRLFAHMFQRSPDA